MTRIHWFEQTEADVPASDDWLSPSEAERLAGFRFPKRRADWRLGRWTAKRAIALHTHLPFREIEIVAAESGAPEVWINGRPAPYSISLSHRAGVAACAIAPPGIDIGCDLEVVEPRDEPFVTEYFTDEEQSEIAASPGGERASLITLLWSAKESALKLLHQGLRGDLRSVATHASPDTGGTFVRWHPLCCMVMHPSVPSRLLLGRWRTSGGLVRTFLADFAQHDQARAAS